MSKIAPIKSFYLAQKLVLSSGGVFHENSLIVACCIFGRFEVRTLTPDRSKDQTKDTLKLLGHNFNHLQGFDKQKKCHSLSLWFYVKISSLLLLRSLFWVNFVKAAVVIQNWINIGSNVYVSAVALLSSV